MLSVINKDKIESMINQFYETAGLNDTHNPLRVTKLSVYAEYDISVGGGIYDEDFIDEDCADDFEFTLVLDCYISDTFYIKPTHVQASNNFEIGITLEWTSNQPLFVISKADYIKLYETFVEYLESTQKVCRNSHGFHFEDMELVLCFKNLYEDTYIADLISENEQGLNPLFTKEHFESDVIKISTLNVSFEF